MGAFDKIIGYRKVVAELEQVAAILRDPEPYERLGARVPGGLMIQGEPGLGKTLMAQCLIEASGLPSVVLRRDAEGNAFLEAIRDGFERARSTAPAIVLLDDLDKFARSDHLGSNEPEYVTVQTCIDNCRGTGVFVVATANDGFRALPSSLVRSGRFDRTIHLERPDYPDAVRIIDHYLSQRAIPNSVDVALVAQFPLSCADLEARVNAAAMAAAGEGEDEVTTAHMLRACVEGKFGSTWTPYDGRVRWDGAQGDRESQERARVACHEAGHALVLEVLDPGSVNLAAVLDRSGHGVKGVTMARRDRAPFSAGLGKDEMRLLVGLGGMAAEECAFGSWDVGVSNDVADATESVYASLLCGSGGLGHLGVDVNPGGMVRSQCQPSPERVRDRETATCDRIALALEKARALFAAHRGLHDRMAQKLFEDGILDGATIARFREEEGEAPFAA